MDPTDPTVAEPAALEQPVDNPGIEEHVERWTDADEAAGNRAYRQVVGMFALVPVLAIAFVVIYFAVPNTLRINLLGMTVGAQHFWLGLTLGLAILLIGVGLVHWAKQIMDDNEISEERHRIPSTDQVREAALAEVDEGVEQTRLDRRRLIGGSLLGAVGIVAVPALVTLADLGPWPTPSKIRETLEKTVWAEDVHLVTDASYHRLRPEDIRIGTLVNAQPEGMTDLEPTEYQRAKAKASIVVVRMDVNDINVPESRQDWHVGGILAYSKICTHVGCPIALWEDQTHHLLCPCHQSTFDLGDAGKVVFGPAARALPQLPIRVNEEGFLVARSDFTVPVGPSYFERDLYPEDEGR
ncbi:cytochrome bc1 complex Rieske iron-sulfur subunit [Parenemella sanctibonifatiensis]|uniref:Cytochrome bc1 complex Rieske iron-sulfur subunit n=1 Tax=Parenemella sanctibonifatiensis TaxID=2016505 RepID=A0A255EP81_9ACTN|nr:Rieske 2Fe-2S domain-containing protein [Parenemella sanctibonifatiensis]OYN89669.1 ubiquinol-cytochrome C reductase [Parenemella sanctibonifatiensis]OYN89943.1 ubiquinol-cytochrome C reductase [Parenemella sanctibonifatiensis]